MYNIMPQESVIRDTGKLRTSENDSSADGVRHSTQDLGTCMCISNSARDIAH